MGQAPGLRPGPMPSCPGWVVESQGTARVHDVTAVRPTRLLPFRNVRSNVRAQLSGENAHLQSQLVGIEYLRKEINRFRKNASEANEESASILRDNLFYKQVRLVGGGALHPAGDAVCETSR